MKTQLKVLIVIIVLCSTPAFLLGPVGALGGLQAAYSVFGLTINPDCPFEPDIDSDYRFFSGNFFGFALAVLVIIKSGLLKNRHIFAALGVGIFLGGIGRVVGLFASEGEVGVLSYVGLTIELVYPIFVLWVYLLAAREREGLAVASGD